MLCDVIMNMKPTFVGASTGLVAGLVGITPGAGFVPIWAAVIIGLTTSPICYFMVSVVKRKLGYDDALDAFGCHGVGGIWGGICTGLFCQASINDIGQGNGLFFGDVKLFLMHLVLPAHRKESMQLLDWLAETLPTDAFLLSLMGQYTPPDTSLPDKHLNRRIATFEYESVREHAVQLGLNGYGQERSSASASYTPDFWTEQ